MGITKRLHLHGTPLVLFALLAVAAATIAGTASYSHTFREAFARPLVKTVPTSNGTASLQLNKPATNAEQLRQAVDKAARKAASQPHVQPAPTSPAVGPSVSNLGESTALQAATVN